ncbi:DUF3795 domain-containing protein [Anaerotignum sp. MB30-C6]|uniref:DUF3795 domain-containing protein n=1 Tax=Anaerotignum sp. MB30-C6 TaxID=3070814 RepID=UPI0027DBED1C|nr:DUF3795 domain-containing protein [Anaerotignum sp. MB30-C6]WMI82202.1 DUF3795 domain-containing protein [Anaerotignum sp. MB30-C6]
MGELISCCGVICSLCQYFPKDCRGCSAIQGKAFWLAFTGEKVCNIYQCCVKEKGFHNCGQCKDLPCNFFAQAYDPTKTKKENEEILAQQLAVLTHLNKDFDRR